MYMWPTSQDMSNALVPVPLILAIWESKTIILHKIYTHYMAHTCLQAVDVAPIG